MKPIPTNILVPTDFSPASSQALSIANGLAATFGSKITLLHIRVVIDHPTVGGEALNEVERILSESEPATLRALERAGADGRTEIHPQIKRGTVPAVAIVKAISEFGCDLVAMGTHGRRGLRRFLVGSVTKEVVHHSQVPVLTTRAETNGKVPPQKILVAYDSSQQSLQGVRVAAAWARQLGADITLLHVLELCSAPRFYNEYLDREVYNQRVTRRCTRALDQVAAENFHDIPHETVVIQGHIAQGISTYAEKNEFDVVVLATRGLTGVTHALLGSVAERVTQLCGVPVLTVRDEPPTLGDK